jgi:small subunit ribosomal protein S15
LPPIKNKSKTSCRRTASAQKLISMPLTKDVKKELAKKHGKSEKDSGSPEVQIAMFTKRINHLTGHLDRLKKDKATQRSLLLLVSKRKHLLDYMKRTSLEKYRALLKTLEIRK